MLRVRTCLQQPDRCPSAFAQRQASDFDAVMQVDDSEDEEDEEDELDF
jgi:hypothetical protein